MNHTIRRLLEGVTLDGSASLFADNRSSRKHSAVIDRNGNSFRDILIASSTGFFRRRVVPFGMGVAMIAQLNAADITEDIAKSTADSVAGLEYAGPATIENITASITAESTGTTSAASYAEGIRTNSSLTIGTIREGASISGNSGYHHGYGIRTVTGDITIGTIEKGTAIQAKAARNFAYAVYTEDGNITITNPIAGTLSATVNAAYAAASAHGYGIYAKSGNITLGGLAETGSIISSSPQTRLGGYLGGIVASNGGITATGSIAGTISAVSYGSNNSGIWAQNGGLSLDSFDNTSVITVGGSANIRGLYSSTTSEVTAKATVEIKGDFGASMTISSSGYYAYGIYAAGSTDYHTADITMKNITAAGSIIVSAASEAFGIHTKYGNIITGDIAGSIEVTSTDKTAYGIAAQRDVTVGNIGEDASITAITKEDAYAVSAGYRPGISLDSVYGDHLTISNIDGTIKASAAGGYSVTLFARSDLTLGDVGANALISASSDSTAKVMAIWTTAGDINTGVINGRILASSGSADAYGIVGLGLANITIGSTGVVSATSTGGRAFALYSGCYQGSSFRSYNLADTLTIYAGAQIIGDIELGGSGSEGHDQINLLGGTDEASGMMDYSILTTINTTNQNESTQKSDVRVTVGSETGEKAVWAIENQSGLFNGVTIHENAVVTVNDDSLSVKEGGFIVNKGSIAGTGTIHIDAGTTFVTGSLSLEDGRLQVTGTGIDSGVQLTIDEGAILGSTVKNEGEGLAVIRQDDIRTTADSLFAGLVGTGYDPDNYTFLYELSGNIALSDSLVVRDGEQYRIGDGVEVNLSSGTLPDHSLILAGGTVDLSSAEENVYTNRQIEGLSGELIASNDQTIRFVQNGIFGYNVTGGTIEVSLDSGEVILAGDYDSDTINVEKGTATLQGENASLGNASGQVAVATGAALINNGTILSTVVTEEGTLLGGSGIFMQGVTLGEGSILRVGNSPGQQIYNSTLDVGAGSSLVFHIDGTTPAVVGEPAEGAYSNIIISGMGSTLTLGGGNTLVLDIGTGLLQGSSEEFSLTLISYQNGAGADASFDEANFTTVLAGLEDLIDPGYSLVLRNDALILNGTLNRGAVEALVRTDAVSFANALWSSTGVVHSFTEKSRGHLDAGQAGKTSFWVDGIGDFMSLSSDGDKAGFESSHGGYAAGVVRGWTKEWSAGLSFGQSFGTNKPKGEAGNIDQDAIMFALSSRYAREITARDAFILEASFGYGSVSNKARSGNGAAKWDDDVFSASLTGKWKMKLDANQSITPFAGIEYIDGAQDGFTHDTSTGSRRYDGADLRRLVIPVGVAWEGVCQVNDQFLIPQVAVMYQGDVSRTNPRVTTSVLGRDARFEGASPEYSAIAVNAGLRWVITPEWSASASYNIKHSSGMTNQSVNAGVSYTF